MTSISISHRIASILNCDMVFVIEKGKIVGKGSILSVDQISKEVKLSDKYKIVF